MFLTKWLHSHGTNKEEEEDKEDDPMDYGDLPGKTKKDLPHFDDDDDNGLEPIPPKNLIIIFDYI